MIRDIRDIKHPQLLNFFKLFAAFSNEHRWDIKNRPGNSELAEHFHKNHCDKDMEVYILQTGIADEKEREFYEDKWICTLQTFQGMNTDLHQSARDMYGLYAKIQPNRKK